MWREKDEKLQENRSVEKEEGRKERCGWRARADKRGGRDGWPGTGKGGRSRRPCEQKVRGLVRHAKEAATPSWPPALTYGMARKWNTPLSFVSRVPRWQPPPRAIACHRLTTGEHMNSPSFGLRGAYGALLGQEPSHHMHSSVISFVRGMRENCHVGTRKMRPRKIERNIPRIRIRGRRRILHRRLLLFPSCRRAWAEGAGEQLMWPGKWNDVPNEGPSQKKSSCCSPKRSGRASVLCLAIPEHQSRDYRRNMPRRGRDIMQQQTTLCTSLPHRD